MGVEKLEEGQRRAAQEKRVDQTERSSIGAARGDRQRNVFSLGQGSCGNPGNEAADKLAVAGARREYVRRYGELEEKERGPRCTLREAPFGWKVVRHPDGTETLEPNPQEVNNYEKRQKKAAEKIEVEQIKVFKSKRRRGGSAAQRMAIKAARAAEAAKAAEAADACLAEMGPDPTSDVAAQIA